MNFQSSLYTLIETMQCLSTEQRMTTASLNLNYQHEKDVTACVNTLICKSHSHIEYDLSVARHVVFSLRLFVFEHGCMNPRISNRSRRRKYHLSKKSR